MKKLLMGLMLLTGLATMATAQSFEGVYNGSFDGSVNEMSCNLAYQGMDGGPFVITQNQFFGVESYCDLTNPTNLRGIDGILFDATCSSEGIESTSRMLLVRDPGGVYMHHHGYMRKLQICK